MGELRGSFTLNTRVKFQNQQIMRKSTTEQTPENEELLEEHETHIIKMPLETHKSKTL